MGAKGYCRHHGLFGHGRKGCIGLKRVKATRRGKAGARQNLPILSGKSQSLRGFGECGIEAVGCGDHSWNIR